MVVLRKAKIDDAQSIKELIEPYAENEVMLSRPIYEIYENIRDFSVADIKGKIVACGSLHVFGKEYKSRKGKEPVLAEIRSLAVARDWQGKKIGTGIVKNLVQDGKALGITKIFALILKNNLGFLKGYGSEKLIKRECRRKSGRSASGAQGFHLTATK